MLKFTLKCASIIVVLFFGVLLGMQQANEGMLMMKGYEDVNFQGAFDFQTNKNGQVEASVLGTKVTAHDLKQKQDKLENMKAFNFFSSLGTKIANFITTIFQGLLHFIFHVIDKIISTVVS